MAYTRINVSGTDFTVANYNANLDALEDLGVNGIGRGVVSGLTLSAGGGFSLAIADGSLSSRSFVELTSIPTYTMPPSVTRYVWIDETGAITLTSSTTYPGGNVVCLGKVTTDGSGITAITEDNRQWLHHTLQEIGQAGGYATQAVTVADVTLDHSIYRKRIIEFTGVLTGNRNVLVPPVAGFEWTLIDSTTGAFAITFKTLAGTGIALTHTKTRKVFCDGTNIRAVTAEL